MHRAMWAVKRAHWWTWMKGRRLLKEVRKKDALTPARFDVLFVLEERGKMMQGALRHVLGVVDSSMSEMLKGLEWRGLVARGKRTKQGRSVEVTPKGLRALADSFMAHVRVDEIVATAFGDRGAWDFDEFAVPMLTWERVCRRVRHACGDTLFKRPFGWLRFEDD